MSTPFRVDLEDFRFVLFDQLRVHERLKALPDYAELDRDTYDATLEEAARIAIEVLHPINRSGDLEKCQFDGKGNVRTPKGFKQAWNRLAEAGWLAVSAPAELGGGGLPATMAMVCNDMFSGAATAFMMYPGLTAAAGRVIHRFGPQFARELVARKLFSGEWAGTMCLTESGAGSAVGDNRCKATPTNDPNVFLLEGEKIFITGGDHDLADNIVHLVLGRTPGSPGGTKGLSLFMVPKFSFDEQGKLGERNGAVVVGIEHKMGIHGSATCTLALGAEAPCKGWLVGSEREGIAVMFHMMNEARLGVAAQGEAMAVTAYNYAVQYARDRVQGTALMARDSDAGRVHIIEHPDVRRMLMMQKVCGETMRSALLRATLLFDLAEAGENEDEREQARGRIDLLMPVLKGHFTDLGFEMAVLGLQTYGGYGYIAEYPIEQLVRDAKIQSIYEGTNGIQALDLLGRKMRIGNGALFMSWMQDVQAQVQAATAAGFASQADAIGKSVMQLGAAAMHLGKTAGSGKVDAAFVHSVPFLRMFGTVVLAAEALDQAMVAKQLIDAGGTSPRLRAKLLGLDFYVAQVLPQATALGKGIQSGDESVLDESLFTV